jgi:hypothetical protein
VRIVEAAPADRDLLFVPDENLGAWVMEQTGRPMTLWKGNCYVHVEWTHASISRIRREFPDAPLVAHPECTKAVRMLADEVCSTEKMVAYCQRATSPQIIIATEAGMLHRLKKECPGKEFIPAPTDNCRCNECRFMKMNTLEKLHDCMANLSPQIELSDEVLRRARLPIERMLANPRFQYFQEGHTDQSGFHRYGLFVPLPEPGDQPKVSWNWHWSIFTENNSWVVDFEPQRIDLERLIAAKKENLRKRDAQIAAIRRELAPKLRGVKTQLTALNNQHTVGTPMARARATRVGKNS